MNIPLRKWYEESLVLVPEISDVQLRRYAEVAKKPLLGASHNREDLKRYLDPLVRHCRAKTRARYWMWLRQQIAKMSRGDAEYYFEYLKESYLPIEYEDALFQYEVYGDTAFIDLGNNRIWKVPADDLTWAKAIFPINVWEVPPLESPELAEVRSLKARLRSYRLGFNERAAFQQTLNELEGQIEAGDIRKMPKRYGIFKKIDGEYVSVARLYLRAGRNETVDALDGDFLNYGKVPAVSVTQPIYFDGAAIVPGVANPQNPVRVEGNGLVPNLYIVQSADNPYTTRKEVQEKFEKAMLPAKYGKDGSLLGTTAMDSDGETVKIETGVPMAVNADLGKGARWFKPLSVDEADDLGLKGWETPVVDIKEPEITAEL
jgi:hypothetical protein